MNNIKRVPNEAMTHSGRFHTDDVFSAALLKILNPQIHIVRHTSVPEGYDGLVFDLGDGPFGHHGSNAEFRESGVAYASFGLLWKAYGNCLVSCKEAKLFDESFIEPLDFQDNNGGNNLLCRAITQMNPKWDEQADADENFFKAVEVAKCILENEIRSMHSTEHAEEIVRKCLAESVDGVVVLPKGMPWKAVLIPEEVYYVVYPSDRGGYNAQAVPTALNTQECKKPFPMEWRGKKANELKLLLDVEDIVFCHPSGYLLCTETKESAVALCKVSLES